MRIRHTHWLAGAAVISALSIGLLWFRPAAPIEPSSLSASEAVTVAASDDFASLSGRQQEAIMNKVLVVLKQADGGEPSAVEKLGNRDTKKFWENIKAYEAGYWVRETQRFHRLTPDQQLAYLDQMIEEQERAGRTMEQKKRTGSPKDKSSTQDGAQGEKGDGKEGERESADDHLKRGIESETPEQRARSLEFKKALRERREARGLSPWPK